MGNPLFDDGNSIDPDTYGVSTSNLENTDDLSVVIVPESIALSESALQMLQSSVDPLRESDSFGADIYMQTVTLVFELMEDPSLIS